MSSRRMRLRRPANTFLARSSRQVSQKNCEERTREVEGLIVAIWKKTPDSGSANVNDSATEVLERGSLASILKTICGFVFGWDGDDATPMERGQQRIANEFLASGYSVDGTMSEEEMMRAGEHSDED